MGRLLYTFLMHLVLEIYGSTLYSSQRRLPIEILLVWEVNLVFLARVMAFFLSIYFIFFESVSNLKLPFGVDIVKTSIPHLVLFLFLRKHNSHNLLHSSFNLFSWDLGTLYGFWLIGLQLGSFSIISTCSVLQWPRPPLNNF